jgi:hypothetical protein
MKTISENTWALLRAVLLSFFIKMTEYSNVEEENLAALIDDERAYPSLALLVALRHENIELLGLALSHRADVLWRPGGRSVLADIRWSWRDKNKRAEMRRIFLEYAKANEWAAECICQNLFHAELGGGLMSPYRTRVDIQTLQSILDVCNVINNVGYDGKTGLMRTLGSDQESLIRWLVKMGADVDAQDSKGQTALFHAAESGFSTAVEALLEQGASPWITDNKGQTALDLACYKYVKIRLRKAMKATPARA